MKRRILVLLAHPSADSFNAAMADRYASAARTAGADVKILKLGELEFDPILRLGYRGNQELEPDLQAARQHIEWAEHLVVFTPVWWGTMPAILKGFIDRVFLPGWAFEYSDKLPVKLLKGRTAQVVATMDSPGIWYRVVYRSSMHRTLGTATLRFIGFKTKFRMLYSVRESSESLRKKWLAQIESMATRQAS